MPAPGKHSRLARDFVSQPSQQTDIVLSNTAEEAFLTDSRFAVQQEAIDEVEAMVTNTGNKVEQHEHLLNCFDEQLDEVKKSFKLNQKRFFQDILAIEETVDNLPAYDEMNSRRICDALARDKMVAMIETLTTKAEALTTKTEALTTKTEALDAKDASLEQQLAAQSAAFEARLSKLEFHHKFSETNQMMGNMDF
ncbi:hypothetical protein ACHAPA_005042 [Fusarium lateritium]